MAEHLSDDELIARLYGVGPQDGHLDGCPECADRWRALTAARARVVQPPAVPEEFVAGQRRAVYRRLGSRERSLVLLPFASAMATAAIVLLAVLLYRPAPAPQPAVVSSDAELYSDIYSMVQSSEPKAAEPIHALFEVQE
jgi:anti-sigma factor RsiW